MIEGDWSSDVCSSDLFMTEADDSVASVSCFDKYFYLIYKHWNASIGFIIRFSKKKNDPLDFFGRGSDF